MPSFISFTLPLNIDLHPFVTRGCVNLGFMSQDRRQIEDGQTKAVRGRGGGSEKKYRRGLVLACLDIFGPTPSCMSFIRCSTTRP